MRLRDLLPERKEEALATARACFPAAVEIRPCLISTGEFLAEVDDGKQITVYYTGVSV